MSRRFVYGLSRLCMCIWVWGGGVCVGKCEDKVCSLVHNHYPKGRSCKLHRVIYWNYSVQDIDQIAKTNPSQSLDIDTPRKMVRASKKDNKNEKNDIHTYNPPHCRN
ncbi:hypothetical protein EV426DRAFT_582521 [Tirmania nivea]|nr:hypothetical protein EV426DRAFT_582521 [Tirmania nivea]